MLRTVLGILGRRTEPEIGTGVVQAVAVAMVNGNAFRSIQDDPVHRDRRSSPIREIVVSNRVPKMIATHSRPSMASDAWLVLSIDEGELALCQRNDDGAIIANPRRSARSDAAGVANDKSNRLPAYVPRARVVPLGNRRSTATTALTQSEGDGSIITHRRLTPVVPRRRRLQPRSGTFFDSPQYTTIFAYVRGFLSQDHCQAPPAKR